MQRVFATIVLMIIAMTTANAQVFMSRTDSSSDRIVGEPFSLGEVGAVIMDTGKEIKFLHVMPADNRLKAYKDVDIKDGDEILMCNGKRIKMLKELETTYKELAVSAEFKMGVKRNNERFIVSFQKADPKDLPKMEMSIVTRDGPNSGGDGTPQVRRMTIGGGQGSGDIAPLFGLGLIIGKKDNVFKVIGLAPSAATALAGVDIKPDDIIESFNGEKIKSTQQLSEMYEKLAVGAKIELQYKRGDKTMQALLTKPEAQGRVIINR